MDVYILRSALQFYQLYYFYILSESSVSHSNESAINHSQCKAATNLSFSSQQDNWND